MPLCHRYCAVDTFVPPTPLPPPGTRLRESILLDPKMLYHVREEMLVVRLGNI